MTVVGEQELLPWSDDVAWWTPVIVSSRRAAIGTAVLPTDAATVAQDALELAGCSRVYVEKVSTRKAATERPGLTAALDYLRRGDTLVVWKLDRLGRSVKEVLTIAGDLHARGIGVRILTGKLSGSYPTRSRKQPADSFRCYIYPVASAATSDLSPATSTTSSSTSPATAAATPSTTDAGEVPPHMASLGSAFAVLAS